MKTSAIPIAAILLLVAAGTSHGGQPEPEITAGPTVVRDGGMVKISFSVSAPTDVEVAILDGKGEVLRHLAAGVLGPNAPAPFKKDSLSQELVWDGKNDRGEKAAGAAEVRVRAGTRAELDRYLGWDGLTLEQEIAGVAVGEAGDIYVASTERSWGRTLLTVIGRDGKYKRTVIPYSSTRSTGRSWRRSSTTWPPR